MRAEYHPLQALLLTASGWVNRHQQHVIEYLVEENRVLTEQLGGKVPRLNDDQRRRLAAKAKVLGRRALDAVATIVTPDTLMRWHHRLIAAKWTYPVKRVGRPGLMKAIKALIVRFALENSSWGYCRIQGELNDVGHCVASTTIANVLKENGIKPAPDRPSSWRTFLKSHWGDVAATDFFTTEVWTPRGLVTFYTLFVIDLKTRCVHIAGITTKPDADFVAQVARNLTDAIDGFLLGHRFLICDRDTKMHRAVQTHPWRRRRGRNPHAEEGSELQRFRGALLSTPTFGTLMYEFSTALEGADGAPEAVEQQRGPV